MKIQSILSIIHHLSFVFDLTYDINSDLGGQKWKKSMQMKISVIGNFKEYFHSIFDIAYKTFSTTNKYLNSDKHNSILFLIQ